MSSSKSARLADDLLTERKSNVDIFAWEPCYLTEEALYFWDNWSSDTTPRDVAPPQTPNSDYGFEDNIQPLPSPFPSLDNLEVPYVREKGVRFCIEALAKHFHCKDYKFNMLQFWFLDIITDCLWRSQDDFKLSVELQKLVLAWVLYFIDILRDPQKNVSRRKFFTIFKEAILIAAELVDEGCDTIPTPENVFALIEEEEVGEEEETGSQISLSDSVSTISSIEITSQDYDNVSLIELEVEGEQRIYELPKEQCFCDKYDTASIDTPTETEILSEDETMEKINFDDLIGTKEIDEEEVFEDIKFYQPDWSIPERFLSSSAEEKDEEGEETPMFTVEDLTICKMENIKEGTNRDKVKDQRRVCEISDQFQVVLDSASTTTSGSRSTRSNESQEVICSRNVPFAQKERTSVIESRILNKLVVHKMWEQRLKDMSNPRKGWVPTRKEMQEKQVHKEVPIKVIESDIIMGKDDDEWVDIILKKQKKNIRGEEDKQLVNFGVLWAIIDFIFKYFYESFQFSLVKLAFQATPNIITQKVNGEWMVPKKIKKPFQRPKDQKKPKKKKTPKPKKEKKEKVKKVKGDKKEAKKKEKKPKPKKPVRLTKEEKAKLARQRKEQQRLEKEMRKLQKQEEEQKRFIFPLRDAATDDLFMGIFDNWVKVERKVKGRRKKK